MSTFLFQKEVDQSLLKSGLTIPINMHEKIQEAVGVQLSKGQRTRIRILLEGQTYDAVLTNVNFSETYSGRIVFQIRYSEGSPLCQKLKELFTDIDFTRENSPKKYIEVFSISDQMLEFKVKDELVDQKQEKHHPSADLAGTGGDNMREAIEKILNDYIPAKKETFAGHPLGAYFRNDIPRKIYDTRIVNSSDYLITGSVGQGNWAMVPWVCIFDRSITTSATKGVYIVYLLAKEGNSLYLTFNQGCTEIRSSHTKRETIRIMREKAAEVASRIDPRGFRTDEDINLGEGLTELGELYQKGTIFYKEYRKDAIPDEAELQSDLAKMMEIYREYVGKDAASEQKAWLLSWNPNNWDWEDYLFGVYSTQNGSIYSSSWSCANTHVNPGDRVFLTVLGNGDKNGINLQSASSSKRRTNHAAQSSAFQGECMGNPLDEKDNKPWSAKYSESRIFQRQKVRAGDPHMSDTDRFQFSLSTHLSIL